MIWYSMIYSYTWIYCHIVWYNTVQCNIIQSDIINTYKYNIMQRNVLYKLYTNYMYIYILYVCISSKDHETRSTKFACPQPDWFGVWHFIIPGFFSIDHFGPKDWFRTGKIWSGNHRYVPMVRWGFPVPMFPYFPWLMRVLGQVCQLFL